MTVGRVEGGRYFVGGFKCARNYARAKRVGASSFGSKLIRNFILWGFRNIGNFRENS